MNFKVIAQSIDEQINRLHQARTILNGTGTGSSGRKRRHMSAEAKARIAAGQRKRWAKVRAAAKKK